jgi:hypothetical protein
MTHDEIVKAKEDRARQEFRRLGPMGRAKWALENCNKSRHPSVGVCLECCAEALDWTIDAGVKLAGGINDQALKLEDAGVAWKKRAEVAELQNSVLRAALAAIVGECANVAEMVDVAERALHGVAEKRKCACYCHAGGDSSSPACACCGVR